MFETQGPSVIYTLAAAQKQPNGQLRKNASLVTDPEVAKALVCGDNMTDYAECNSSMLTAAISMVAQEPRKKIPRYQEDRFMFAWVPTLVSSNPTEQQDFMASALRSTVKALQTQCGKQERTGSTALLAAVYGNYIVAANLGDSSLFYCHISANREIHFSQINQWQKATERLRPIGLALSHAIGDTLCEPYGLSHDPSLHIFDIPAEGCGFVIAASDGLTDYLKVRGENSILRGVEGLRWMVTQYFKTHDNPNEQDLVNTLAAATEYAIDKEKRYDNVTIVVKKIDSKAPPTLIGVFDGHGGAQVAEACRRRCLPLLLEAISSCNNDVDSDNEGSLPPTESLGKLSLASADEEEEVSDDDFALDPVIEKNEGKWRPFEAPVAVPTTGTRKRKWQGGNENCDNASPVPKRLKHFFQNNSRVSSNVVGSGKTLTRTQSAPILPGLMKPR